jgi:dienelactone hydrolase
MRPLEIALSASLLPYVAYLLSPWRPESGWFLIFPVVSILLMACHFVFEGYRWQMGPAYALTIFVAAYPAIQLFSTFRISYPGGLVMLLSLMSAILLSTLAPVFQLPLPSGPHRIGTQIRHIVDSSRQDPQADIPGSPRELMIQIWYPADVSMHGRLAPYREKSLTTIRNARLSLVETHSVLDAPLSQSQPRYPVLIFSPSWRGQRTENTFLSEELASHGYIVIAIDHPYSTSETLFPDGRIAHTKLLVEETYSSEDAFRTFLDVAEEQVTIRTRDAQFVLDTLERINAADPERLLTGRIDLDHVGILGFSFGGTVAAQACSLDRRFKAGVDMDGMLAAETARHGVFAPFFFVTAQAEPNEVSANDTPATRRETEFNREQHQRMLDSLSTFGGYWMSLPGTSHANFSDRPFFSPWRFRSGAGSVDAEKAARTVGRYLLAFFDQQFKSIGQPLLDGPSAEFPNVRFQAWKTPAGNARRGI